VSAPASPGGAGEPPAFELLDVHKRFGAIEACRGATVRVARGEIHALVGENGAGKSTLVRVLGGLVHPDRGEIRVRGAAVGPMTPARAIALGIGIVHQHFMLVPALSVVENVVLGREPVRKGRLDLSKAKAELAALAGRFGMQVDPDRRVEHLSVGEAQRVEILKVLWRGADILVLDEPTAVLSPPEARELYRVVRSLTDSGKTCLVITHKLDEVMAASRRLTVLRRGQTVAELETSAATPEAIARAMVGRDVVLPGRPARTQPAGEVLLEARDLQVGRALRGVSLSVRAGEILGVAGVEGNGQTELALALAGLLRPVGGQIHGGLAAGHIPEDRLARGLVLDFTLEENLILGRQRQLWGTAAHAEARRALGEWDIRPADPGATARTLSGGNQQKLVVARELARGARVIIAAQPTRGVDIGAVAEIHRRLLEAREAGAAILLLSAELSELLALADRIIVLYKGRIVAEFDDHAASEEALGIAMTGAGGAG
jgi:simple sugar transport system ATP-binding protein